MQIQILRENRIKDQDIKEKSRESYREYKEYLEVNEKNWEMQRIEQELETKRKAPELEIEPILESTVDEITG